jgi:hypothetical protein
MHKFRTLKQTRLEEKFVVGGWWVMGCKPILGFSFDFGQAEP